MPVPIVKVPLFASVIHACCAFGVEPRPLPLAVLVMKPVMVKKPVLSEGRQLPEPKLVVLALFFSAATVVVVVVVVVLYELATQKPPRDCACTLTSVVLSSTAANRTVVSWG